MKKPSVAIIIINWNSYDYTYDCINSLGKIHYDSAEIILVDNASTDDSVTRLRQKFPSIHFVLNEENLGFTGGNNVGIEYALQNEYDYLLLLNNDTFVQPDFLSVLINSIDGKPEFAAAQPKIFYNHDRGMLWHAGGMYFRVISRPWVVGYRKRDKARFNKKKEVDWITGCAFLVKAQVVREVGLTSDLFFYGCYDDVEWSLRMRDAGYKLLYCPESVIYHAVTVSSKSDNPGNEGFLKPYFHYLVSRNHWFLLRLRSRHVFKFTSCFYQLIKFVLYTLYFLLRNRPKKLKAFFHGFYHGLTKSLEPKALNHKHYIQYYK